MKCEIEVIVKSVKGKCINSHKVGDKIVFGEKDIKGSICIHALYSLLPKVFAMMYGAEFHWLSDGDPPTHACPDAENPVVFKLRRKETKC